MFYFCNLLFVCTNTAPILNLCVSEDQISGCWDAELLCPSQPSVEMHIDNVAPLSFTKHQETPINVYWTSKTHTALHI